MKLCKIFLYCVFGIMHISALASTTENVTNNLLPEQSQLFIELQKNGSYNIVSIATGELRSEAALKAKKALGYLCGEKLFCKNSSFIISTESSLSGVTTLSEQLLQKSHNENVFVVTLGMNSRNVSTFAQINDTYDELSRSILNEKLAKSGLFFKNPLGPLNDARKKYPEIFSNKGVMSITLHGIPCYVFSGEAKINVLAEDEAYSTACINAKKKLYEFLTEKKSKSVVFLSMCMAIYQYKQDEHLTTIMVVPQKNVIVKNETNCSKSNNGTEKNKK